MNTPRVEYRGGGNVLAIKQRVRLSQWVSKRVQLRQSNGEFIGLCPFHEEKSPSFSVNDKKGFYHCFGCGAHGDIFEWVQKTEHCNFKDAAKKLGEHFHVTPDYRPAPAAAPAPEAPPKNVDWLAGAWTQAKPSDNSLVRDYLEARGIRTARLPSRVFSYLRFEPQVLHRESGLKLPAMLARISSVDGKMIGLHRTFLQNAGGAVGKAAVSPAKKMFGSFTGGAVQLFAPGSTLGIAEGIETALSVWQATGLPVWPALSIANLSTIKIPACVREIVLCIDNDMKDEVAGKRGWQQAAVRHAANGLVIRVAKPPRGQDFNDMLRGAK
jgi:DNA primase